MEYRRGNSTSWSEVRRALEQSRERELETLKEQLREVEQQIREREEISEEKINQLEDSIYNQSKRLEQAERNPDPEATRVRDRLERLYREKREE